MKSKKLKTRITSYLIHVVLVTMLAILIAVVIVQLYNERLITENDARDIFAQVDQILTENSRELSEVQEEYDNTCISSARTVAYIIQYHPEIVKDEDIEELFKVASYVQVDEIHIFNKEGVIIFGTQPQYYGYSFDSGEQMNFFKPMLEDYTLELVQDIAPNTAEGKLVQYSALWSEDKEFIVEVGMYPDRVLSAREKNELSYIFSLLGTNVGVDLYAIDEDTGEVLGCTNTGLVGQTAAGLGFEAKGALANKSGSFKKINGVRSYVITNEMDGTQIAYVIPVSLMYEGTAKTILLLGLALLVIAYIMVVVTGRFLDSFVIDRVYQVNSELRRITDGDLSVRLDIDGSQEFSELGDHINEMIKSILDVKHQIEVERDADFLTGLYNRRGFEHALRKAIDDLSTDTYCAIVMVDADGLKNINDTLGHDAGDEYLKSVANMLRDFDRERSICARQGGDEFVMLLFGYENRDELDTAISQLRTLQDGMKAQIAEHSYQELRFSMGAIISQGYPDYGTMLKEADMAMYEDKRNRKKAMHLTPAD